MNQQKYLIIILIFLLSSCQTRQYHLTLLSNEPINMTNFSVDTTDTQNYKVISKDFSVCIPIKEVNKMVQGKTFVNATVEEKMGNEITINLKGYDVTK